MSWHSWWQFSPTFMECYSLCAPRMRFIVLNNLAGLAWTEKKMTSDARLVPWFTPLIFVRQSSAHSKLPWHCPQPNLQCGRYHNYQVKQIAEIIAEIFKGCQLSRDNGSDNQLSCLFEKINKTLPGFKCEWNAALCSANVWFVHYWYVRIHFPI